MINTGYECPDISKDLHMNSLNAWNSNGVGQGIQNGIYKLRWNTPLPNTFIDETSYELYFDIYHSDQRSLQKYNILSTINNEKRDRMLKVFNMPRSFGYELVDKSKRLEIGYYCKDKKVFKTHFDNKKFISNEKMINKIGENYYKIMTGYYREGTITEPKTLGKLITNYTKNKNFDNNLFDESLVFRHFQNIKDYLNETDSNKKILIMMVSRMKEYKGGGEKYN